ncbi:hypothetical protein ACIA5A_03265 [Micromonospora sp. NPDC051300]|uniref:hypothetical protein n=1 Tax=Micromonospora sp. NPDC051300 TaxID=3364286 RepID=UPI0037944A0D
MPLLTLRPYLQTFSLALLLAGSLAGAPAAGSDPATAGTAADRPAPTPSGAPETGAGAGPAEDRVTLRQPRLLPRPGAVAPTTPPPLTAPRRGDLDPTFGTRGVTLTGFPDRAVGASSVVTLPDGSLVAGGGDIDAGSADFLLTRYRCDGTLDSRFGSAGRVTTPLPGQGGGVQGLAVDRQRRIVAAGTASLGTGDQIGFALVRYLPDGRPDPRFGTGGRVIQQIGPVGNAGATAVLVQPDDKIVVAGGANDADGNAVFAAARFRTDGRLDPTFGDGGATLVLIPGGDASAFAVTRQRDGKIVLAGAAIGPGVVGQQFALVRLTTAGRPDPTFGGDGIVTAQNVPSQGQGGATDVAVDADGTILAGGLGQTATGEGQFGLMRFRPDGTLDPTFGDGTGKVLTEVDGGSVIRRVLLRPRGRIVAVGAAGQPSTVALAGYLRNGDLDPSFGDDGRTTTAVGALSAGLGGTVQFDRIVVAGASGNDSLTEGRFLLARYLDGRSAHCPRRACERTPSTYGLG